MNEMVKGSLGPVGVLTRHAHRVVYGTVVLIVALGRFDASDAPASGTLTELMLISVGPLLVLAVAHVFADSVGNSFANDDQPTLERGWAILTSSLIYPAVAIPTVVLALVLSALGKEPLLAAQLSQTACWLSLGAWGFAGARRRGRSLGRQFGAALGYFALGFLVVAIEFLVLG